ncbi:hypothetical protein BEWA_012540 [Theileria equi strain WA]|uniref:Uncharacterized protein n=1 Tax=Theileria equi strain WA TaxID=1537102 RepID=L1LBQ2_THEEQ|nr:hypothetical protein BEWA_012540 [Theileria equi strain WA]EKX72695.1 hypothetical protein BEWA_012540 [Theileria equi strain WA]|eukprot:XP_004832147.1 hypothetical protein BEWA_012540 [Theileria equi strain WA]
MSGKTVEIDISKNSHYNNVKVTPNPSPDFGDGKPLVGYKSFTHRPYGGYTIKNIICPNTYGFRFNGNTSATSTVEVFVWNDRSKESNPLLLRLNNGVSPAYYSTVTGSNWKGVESIDPSGLIKLLERTNCRINGIHLLDINQTTNSASDIYNCPSCYSGSSTITRYEKHMSQYEYVRYYYASSSGNFGNVRNSDQTIALPPGIVPHLYVYWSIGTNATPLILSYPVEGKYQWYIRSCGDTKWNIEGTLTGQNPGLYNNPGKIQDFIQKNVTPNIIINLQQERTNSYHPKDNTLEFNVEVTENPEHSGYYEYKHSMVGEGTFKVRSVEHGRKTLDGIKPEKIISSISGFYWGDNTKDDNRLLLVHIGARTEYYYKKNPYSSNWDIDSSIYQENLLVRLDQENCVRNKAHVADISKVSEYYRCYACSGQSINMVSSDEDTDKYKRVTHKVDNGGSIGRIFDNDISQSGIKIPDKIVSLIVFHYPKVDNKALLIHLSNSLFKRKHKDSDEWVSAEGDKLDGDDSSNILPLLKKINGDSEGLSGGDIAGYSTAGVMTPLATAEAVNYTLDTGWSIIRRAIAIFNAAI